MRTATNVLIATTVILALLKSAGVITWPWFWVFAPITIPSALVVMAFISLMATMTAWRIYVMFIGGKGDVWRVEE